MIPQIIHLRSPGLDGPCLMCGHVFEVIHGGLWASTSVVHLWAYPDNRDRSISTAMGWVQDGLYEWCSPDDPMVVIGAVHES